MHDKYEPPPVWKQEPIKLVVVEHPEPDEQEEVDEFLAAIKAVKDDDTELIIGDNR